MWRLSLGKYQTRNGIGKDGFTGRLRRVFHTHINPYEVFEIHLENPSFLNAA
jgi:hypothetical protein